MLYTHEDTWHVVRNTLVAFVTGSLFLFASLVYLVWGTVIVYP